MDKEEKNEKDSVGIVTLLQKYELASPQLCQPCNSPMLGKDRSTASQKHGLDQSIYMYLRDTSLLSLLKFKAYHISSIYDLIIVKTTTKYFNLFHMHTHTMP
jgi:hypothetical protein